MLEERADESAALWNYWPTTTPPLPTLFGDHGSQRFPAGELGLGKRGGAAGAKVMFDSPQPAANRAR